MTLADINSDGNYKLIISDLGTGTTNIKLKVQMRLSICFFRLLQHKDETSYTIE